MDNLHKQFMVYFMNSVVGLSCGAVPSDHLHVMSVKVAYRLLKLNLSSEPAWFPFVQRTLESASKNILGHWQKVIAQNSLQNNMSDLVSLDFHEDINLSLPGINQYLDKINRQEEWYFQTSVEFSPQSNLANYKFTELPDDLDFGFH